MTTLDQIAIDCGTDKSSKYQGYTLIYPQYLDSYPGTLKLLEIGVQDGRSIRMWREYFPKAEIFGIEKTPQHKSYIEDLANIFIGDQENAAFLEDVGDEVGPFDVIIDDGGHMMNQQIISFETLWPYVKKEGIYIIEDLDTSYREEFGGGLKERGTTVEYMKNKLDRLIPRAARAETDIKFMHFYEEILFIGKK